jgi:phosphatidylinositol alpha-mannosyltransferase
MKICMVVPYDLAEEGGVKRHATQLAASLRLLGDEVDVIGPCSDDRALTEHTYGFRGIVNIPANGSDNRLGIFVRPHKVWRLIRERRYDVIHVHEPLQPSLNYYAVWSASSKAARVATFHAVMEHESTALKRARQFWSAVAFPSYDRGIAVSPAAAEYARMTFGKSLAIIPNGIRTELYQPVPPPPSPSNNALRILFVGHWRDSRKGLPHLLDACATLRERGVPWTLDVIGDGGQQPRIELPGVTYHGPVRSERAIAERYRACDVFVSPALSGESFGIVLLEAMAAARAIVCSDIPGYRYAVGAGAESGARLVAPGASESIATALAELAADPAARLRLGAINRERVRMFEWDRLVARVRDEYVAALASRGRSATAGTSGSGAPGASGERAASRAV